VERAMILLYLYHYPEDIIHWNNGWHLKDAPGLSKMVEKIGKKIIPDESSISGKDMLSTCTKLIWHFNKKIKHNTHF
jgi:hypothetical protein